MSRTHSPRASSSTRSAISFANLALLAFLAACAQTLSPPTALITAPAAWHVGVPLQLDGSKSTAFERKAPTATPPLGYHWSFLGVPPRSAARLNDPALAMPSFTPDVPGAYTLQLFVDDGVFASPPVTASVAVSNDCAPVIASFKAAAAPAVGDTVVLGATTSAPCAGTDAAGDAIVKWSWSFAAVPAGSRAVIAQASSAAASFVADVRGDYDVVLVATDALGLSNDPSAASSHLKITAQPCGDNPPAVVSLKAAPAAPDVLQPVALSAVVTDADVDSCGLKRALTYAWQLTAVPSGSLAALNNAAVKAPSFTPDVRGDYVVALTVSDELGRRSARQTLTVSTSACGSAVPVAAAQITTPSSGNIAVGQLVQLGTGVLDTDNPGADGGLNPTGFDGGPSAGGACALALTFSYDWTLLTAPQGSHVVIAGSLANPSFKPDVFGDYTFSVVVTASTGKVSAPSFVTVHVVNCGSLAPVAAVTAPAGWITGRPLGAPDLSSTITDPNSAGTCTLGTAPYQYAWSLVQVPPGSAATLSGTGLAGTSAQTTPSFTPEVAGQYTLGLVVTDSLGLSSAQAIALVTAGACNVPITVGAPTVKAGTLITGQPLQFTAAVTDLNDPGATPGTPASGACQAPVFPLAYAWALVDQPQGSAAQLSSGSTAAPSIVPDKTGSYGLVLAVVDAAGNRGLSQKASFNVATSCNSTPTVTVSVTTSPAVTGSPVALLATPVDSNGPVAGGCVAAVTPFSFAWTLAGQPAGSRAQLNNTSAANPSFVPDVAGDYLLNVVVTDAAGNKSAPTPTTVTVSTTCTAPLGITAITVSGGAASTALSAGIPVLLAATVSDPNAPAAGGCTAATLPYSYLWSLVALPSGSKAALNNRNAATPSFTPDIAAGNASYSVQLVVTDAAGNKSPTVQADLNVTAAQSCVRAPTVSGMTFTTAGSSNVTSNPVTLGVTAVNPNPGTCYTGGATAALQYQWSLVARPPRSNAQLTDPFAPAPKYTPDATGTYVVSVRVNDALGNAATLNGTSPAVTQCGSAFTVAATVQSSPAEIGATVGLSAVVADPSNAAACGLPSAAPFSYAWLLTPPAASASAVLSNDRAAKTSFVPDVAGSYNYAVSVTDAAGVQVSVASAAATATLPVDVRNCAITPSITPTGATTGLNVGTLQALAGAFAVNAGCGNLYTGSAGGNPLPVRYQWSFDSVPAGSNAFLSNQNGPGSGFTIDRPGVTSTWVVRLTVQDLVSGASASATASFTASSCGTANITGYAGVFLGPACNGTTCTLTPVAPAAVGTAVPHACPPNASGTCTGAVTPDITYTVGTTALPYNLELFAGDPTSVAASTNKASAGSPNAACGGVLSYTWTPYQVPPGSGLSSFNGFGPTNAAQPGARLDVKGDYVFQLYESDQIGGSPFGGSGGSLNLPAKQASTYLWVQVK